MNPRRSMWKLDIMALVCTMIIMLMIVVIVGLLDTADPFRAGESLGILFLVLTCLVAFASWKGQLRLFLTRWGRTILGTSIVGLALAAVATFSLLFPLIPDQPSLQWEIIFISTAGGLIGTGIITLCICRAWRNPWLRAIIIVISWIILVTAIVGVGVRVIPNNWGFGTISLTWTGIYVIGALCMVKYIHDREKRS